MVTYVFACGSPNLLAEIIVCEQSANLLDPVRCAARGNRMHSRLGCDPSNACDEATTGLLIAIASSTLFWIPRAIRNGTTENRDSAIKGARPGLHQLSVFPAAWTDFAQQDWDLFQRLQTGIWLAERRAARPAHRTIEGHRR